MSRFSSITDVWDYLDQIPMFSKKGVAASNFGLDSISKFCNRIGAPHRNFKSIHVAGTNGKGTVTYLLEAIYRKTGYKTGAFTSPHLLVYNERVRISGENIHDSKILEFFQNFELVLEEIPLTYFEISTALAFWAFADSQVDIAIIECGLGGRLDSTNIINPECAVITSIGLDHQSILGDTKAKIAHEKAGIIKNNVPVVIGNLPDDAIIEIEKSAISNNSKLIKSEDLVPFWDIGTVHLKGVEHKIITHLIEPINASNIAIAYCVVEELKSKYPLEINDIVDAISGLAHIPARFEKLISDRQWYFSGSHNIDALWSLIDGINQFEGQNITIVLSLMQDKITSELSGVFKSYPNIYFYEMEGERAANFEDVKELLAANSITEHSFKTILDELNNEVVIFTGSFYFYPIVKRWLTQFN